MGSNPASPIQNVKAEGAAPSASSFLHRSDLPHEACVKSVLADSPARSCGVRERSGRANPAFSLRVIHNALAERLPFLHVANRSDLPHEACVKSVLEDSPARSCGVRERTGRANPAFRTRMHWTGKPRLACPVRFCSFRPMKVPLQKCDKVRQSATTGKVQLSCHAWWFFKGRNAVVLWSLN